VGSRTTRAEMTGRPTEHLTPSTERPWPRTYEFILSVNTVTRGEMGEILAKARHSQKFPLARASGRGFKFTLSVVANAFQAMQNQFYGLPEHTY
jgi:hypothetical protein